jgi:hypothetical membrane protein
VIPGDSPTSGGAAHTARLLRLGCVIPPLFIATTIACGIILGGYNHLSRMVSELGALGTPSRYLFSSGLVACAALSVVFVVGLCRACDALSLSRLPALALLSYSVSIAGAGLFPLPLRMHLVMGMPSVLLIASPATALLLWRRGARLPGITTLSAVALGLMALGFLAFLPGALAGLPGLKQRFFHLGWCVWFCGLSWSFARARGEARPHRPSRA